MATAAVDCPG